MALFTLDDSRLDAVLAAAQISPRRRSNFNMHGPDDTLQRMVNAMCHGTYCQPHKHENPDKLEIFTVMRGEIAVPTFDDQGHILEVARLSAQGPIHQVEIAPRTWHTVVVLSESAVLYEIIEGRYHPATHKRFADFAPGERDAGAENYLKELEKQIRVLPGR
jgi:cupin fold WbuC family metalloprotein